VSISGKKEKRSPRNLDRTILDRRGSKTLGEKKTTPERNGMSLPSPGQQEI